MKKNSGEHYFLLTALPHGNTKFTYGEKFSGILTGAFLSRMEAATKAGFQAMNQALKLHAETPTQDLCDSGYMES